MLTSLRFMSKISRGSIKRWIGGGALSKGHDLLQDDGTSTKISVGAMGDKCFSINNVIVRQSVILLPNTFLLWSPKTFDEINCNTLEIFSVLHPTIEILFLGCGDRMPGPLSREITEYFRSKGIVIEATSTSNAASTFNILNAEGRNVAAALLTSEPWSAFDPEKT